MNPWGCGEMSTKKCRLDQTDLKELALKLRERDQFSHEDHQDSIQGSNGRNRKVPFSTFKHLRPPFFTHDERKQPICCNSDTVVSVLYSRGNAEQTEMLERRAGSRRLVSCSRRPPFWINCVPPMVWDMERVVSYAISLNLRDRVRMEVFAELNLRVERRRERHMSFKPNWITKKDCLDHRLSKSSCLVASGGVSRLLYCQSFAIMSGTDARSDGTFETIRELWSLILRCRFDG